MSRRARPAALAAAALLASAVPASAQRPALAASRVAVAALPDGPAAAAPRRKSPAVAATLGVVVPGLGHFYAHEPRRGLAFAVVSAVAGSVALAGPAESASETAAVVWIAAWALSAVDAPLAATRFNERREREAAPVVAR